MDIFYFATIVISVDIISFAILVVSASKGLDRWVQPKEEEYLYVGKEHF
jgi:hypothetical protein